MATPLGTIQDKYGKKWAYVNPNVLHGPNTWDVAVIPFAPDGCIDGIEGVLPIVSEQDRSAVHLTFSIDDLEYIKNVSSAYKPLAKVRQVQQAERSSPKPMSICLEDITATLPVQSTPFREKRIIHFSILDLTDIIDFPNWSADEGLPYNGTRNLNGVSGEEPLVTELVGETVNVSFNINLLPAI